MSNLKPVIAIGAKQDEVDQKRQNEQERSESDKNSAGIKKKPNAPHGFSLLAKVLSHAKRGMLDILW
jgi:hypothetical protein